MFASTMGRTGRERHDTGGLANFQQVGGEITMGDIVLQQTYEFGSGCDGCHSLLFARVRLPTTLSEHDKMRPPCRRQARIAPVFARRAPDSAGSFGTLIAETIIVGVVAAIGLRAQRLRGPEFMMQLVRSIAVAASLLLIRRGTGRHHARLAASPSRRATVVVRLWVGGVI